jgi:aminoglycoside phosphotransferase (APT) family kinase protein
MKRLREDIRPSPRHGWLVLVVPADARRIKVLDSELAAVFADAGGEIVPAGGDIEVGQIEELSGEAPAAIVPVEAASPDRSRPRTLRAWQRLAGTAAVRAKVVSVRRQAKRLGYTDIFTVTWEPHVTLLEGLHGPAPGGALFQRFPHVVLVVCHRSRRVETAFEAARAAAERELGRSLDVGQVFLGSSGVVVAPAEEVILRVSLGPAARRVDEQRSALELLRAAAPSDAVLDRVPWVLATGTAGLARWSVEQRLRGTTPPQGLQSPLAADCVDFLCDLHAAREGGTHVSTADDAAVAALHFPDRAEALRELGAWIESSLTAVTRGFGHGDFWSGNLLVDGERLAGVVDWPSAGPGCLPLLDLLHLRANELRGQRNRPLAAVIAEHLLPEARAGGHPLDRTYCRRLGLDLGARELEALVASYWLAEVRHDLLDPDRDPADVRSPEWRSAQMRVLNALGSPA